MDSKAAGVSGSWFGFAGVLLVARAAMELADPAYYEPATPFDYVAATLSSIAWLAAAFAMVRWWLARPANRASFLLLLAAAGLAASAVGNLLEDVVDVRVGEFLFVFGGILGAISTLVAGVVLLVSRGGLWPGLALLLFTLGSTFPDNGGGFLSGASLIMLGYVIHRRVPTGQSAPR